jgi:hypothetical protein
MCDAQSQLPPPRNERKAFTSVCFDAPMRASLLVLTVFFGCGGDETPGDGDGGSGMCKVTLSGSVSGTYDCSSSPTASYDMNKNQSAVTFGVGDTLTVGISWSGDVRNATFRSTDTDAKGGVTSSSGMLYWAAVAGAANPSDDQGTYALALTSSSRLFGTAMGSAYTVHGTCTATMPGLAGATGTVSLSASF